MVHKILNLFILGFTFLNVGCGDKATSFGLASTEQIFGQVVTYNNKVDILFVIDNSPSMSQYQQRLSAKVPEMISTLNSLKMDYHVAVTSSTMGLDTSRYPMTRQILGSPKFLTSENINLLSDRLLVGETGSDIERSLDSMVFVTGNYAATQAPGYLRSDALFAVIFLGDEEDSSSEFGNSSSNDFVNYLNKLKPPFKEGGRAWIANYIGILTNQSCDNLGVHVGIGFNYLRLVDASQGVRETICAGDLSLAISNIKARLIDQLTRFRLKSAPNKLTIRVAVGGKIISEDSVNGWTLEAEMSGTQTSYFIKFHGRSIPAADQGISIDFTPAGAT